MNVQELKRAITLLKILKYEDLIKFNQILISQNDYINTILAEKRLQIIRLLNRKNIINDIFNELNNNITQNYVVPAGNHITSLQSSLRDLTANVIEVMNGAATLTDSSFEGNIFNLQPSFKEAINNYTGDEIMIIYANTSKDIIDSISLIIRDHINNIEKNNELCKIHDNVLKKAEKITKLLVGEVLNIISIRNKIKTLITDIDNAKLIKNKFNEEELKILLSQNFSQIRGELNV